MCVTHMFTSPWIKIQSHRSRVRVIEDCNSVGWSDRDLRSRAVCFLYDTRCYSNVRLKADISQLNLPHGNNNEKVENGKTKK